MTTSFLSLLLVQEMARKVISSSESGALIFTYDSFKFVYLYAFHLGRDGTRKLCVVSIHLNHLVSA